MKRVALMATVAVLAGLTAGCGPINQMSRPDPATGRLLDQGTSADRFMVLNCIYHGWSELSTNVDSTSYARQGADRVRVYRGHDKDNNAIYNPYVDVMQGGFGARIQYFETPGSNLPRDFENTVKRCMVPYAGSND
ncbi:hypothetical protein UC34_14540 [Pandoraea vervacti]|uniref:Lipoprotein n=2 Tax=Pandoraea TaxID=93217 RepID=A0A5E4ZL66_9BURK|nr:MULTISPECIES: hypothetical protein [Pandoraea]AJP57866.1 hypothetical protein UC34_14540 [Pandoraea vervacti]VVE61010.1 hypothetical protein PCA31118_00432 [Pandoraea captiosa]